MKKKIVLFVVAAFILASFHRAKAQPAKDFRVGVLGPAGRLEDRPDVKGLRAGLPEAGYVEGKNLLLKISAVKTYDELRPIAKAYVGEKIDAILTAGGTATGIAKEATKDIPIIFFAGVADPVELGFVKSLARPETNITGVASEPGIEISGKRLELFKELVPTMSRVALLHNARGENSEIEKRLVLLREIAPKLGLKLAEKPIRAAGEVEPALSPVSRNNTQGIFLICSGLFREPFKKIVAMAMEKKLPLWGCFGEDQGQGNLATYNPDSYQLDHRAAWYVDRILKGTKPANLPVERPSKFEFVINLKVAKQIGLTIPPEVLFRADRVIK